LRTLLIGKLVLHIIVNQLINNVIDAYESNYANFLEENMFPNVSELNSTSDRAIQQMEVWEQRLLHGLAKWSTRDCQYEIEVHAMRQRFQVYWCVRFCGKIALVILSDDSCITLPWRKTLQMHFLNCIIFVQIISKKMEVIGNKILFEKIIWNLNFIIVI